MLDHKKEAITELWQFCPKCKTAFGFVVGIRYGNGFFILLEVAGFLGCLDFLLESGILNFFQCHLFLEELPSGFRLQFHVRDAWLWIIFLLAIIAISRS